MRNQLSFSFFSSYLGHRTQCVYINGKHSTIRNVNSGVTQGSVLGPLLVCIYINDPSLFITTMTSNAICLQYDKVLHSSNKDCYSLQEDLQLSLNGVEDWCKWNDIIINPLKTKCRLVTARQKGQISPLTLQLTLGQDSVEQVSEHKVLGIIVDDELRWQSQTDYIYRVLAKSIFLFSKLKHNVDI